MTQTIQVGRQVADQATVEARLDELALVYSLPAPVRRATRSAHELDFDWRSGPLYVPPSVHLDMRDAAAVATWAAQLGAELRVKVYDLNGVIWRVTQAICPMLGWRIFVGDCASPTWRHQPPMSLLRAAHAGWL